MKVDFIEIGTSDFGTEIEKAEDYNTGISIEAVGYYFDKLPQKIGVIRHHVAVSDCEGKCDISYINPKVVQKFIEQNAVGHSWIKGCNRIDSEHPLLQTYLNIHGLKREDVVLTETVEKKPLYSIIQEDGISGIYYLKIDTEGHDVVILRKFFQDIIKQPQLFPQMIQFESNANITQSDVTQLTGSLEQIGYSLVSRGEDTILRLNLHKRSGHTFTVAFHNYYIPLYPLNYHHTLHENTLESAQQYCMRHNCSGVTLQDGQYQVRYGDNMLPVPKHMANMNIISWAMV
jgi:hypothetical protein